MVKTRNQNEQSKNLKRGLTTRSGFELKHSEVDVDVDVESKKEKIVLPPVKMSKEMKRRANVRKEIAKKSWKKQTDKKCKRFERVEREFLEHVYHNAGEMTAIWKNFEMAFRNIDSLLVFKRRVEGK
jgi:Asp-tRNA(Asn)/Glu-tRNA(Gln) amidotransferase A subunit family amidase